jgi:hypothetical protein
VKVTGRSIEYSGGGGVQVQQAWIFQHCEHIVGEQEEEKESIWKWLRDTGTTTKQIGELEKGRTRVQRAHIITESNEGALDGSSERERGLKSPRAQKESSKRERESQVKRGARSYIE